MAQNWTETNGVKMNNEIFSYIKTNNFFIILRAQEDEESEKMSENQMAQAGATEKRYPWLAYYPPKCRFCGRWDGCPCPKVPVPSRPLHIFTWDFFNGAKNPRKKGEVIHHRNLDKLDARLKNLGKGSRRVHGLAHKAHRQKFSQRKKYHLGGLYRPHLPARVISRPELIGTIVAPEVKQPPMPSKEKNLRELEKRLGALYDDISGEMEHMDSGVEVPTVPASEWRTPRTRMLGITMPNLEPSSGEAVFVMLLVKYKYDIDAVAAATKEHPDLLQALYKRPAVSQALGHWRKYKVLPLAP